MPDPGDQQLLAELARHPGWAVLGRLLDGKKKTKIEQLGKKLLVQGEVPASEADEARGFFRGCEWLLRQADNAFRNVYEEDNPSG
jgi:hypothetical protein